MSDLDTAKQEAERSAKLPAHQAVEALAERLGAVAAARAVFSDPVEREGVTVIPVARVRWGFGAGGGTGGLEGTKEHGEGGGGGGGVSASPLGYIEISEEGASFHEIHDLGAVWPIILASGFAAWLVLRGLRKLLR